MMVTTNIAFVLMQFNVSLCSWNENLTSLCCKNTFRHENHVCGSPKRKDIAQCQHCQAWKKTFWPYWLQSEVSVLNWVNWWTFSWALTFLSWVRSINCHRVCYNLDYNWIVRRDIHCRVWTQCSFIVTHCGFRKVVGDGGSTLHVTKSRSAPGRSSLLGLAWWFHCLGWSNTETHFIILSLWSESDRQTNASHRRSISIMRKSNEFCIPRDLITSGRVSLQLQLFFLVFACR